MLLWYMASLLTSLSLSSSPPPTYKMDVFRGFLTTLDEVVFPSLSLLSCNCGIAEEVWSMVKYLPYERRYVTCLLPSPLSTLSA